MDLDQPISPELQRKLEEDRKLMPPPPSPLQKEITPLQRNRKRNGGFEDERPSANKRQVEFSSQPDSIDHAQKRFGFVEHGHSSQPINRSDDYDVFAESSGASEARRPRAHMLDRATDKEFFFEENTPLTLAQFNTSFISDDSVEDVQPPSTPKMKNSKLWKPEGLEGRDVHDSGLHPFENLSSSYSSHRSSSTGYHEGTPAMSSGREQSIQFIKGAPLRPKKQSPTLGNTLLGQDTAVPINVTIGASSSVKLQHRHVERTEGLQTPTVVRPAPGTPSSLGFDSLTLLSNNQLSQSFYHTGDKPAPSGLKLTAANLLAHNTNTRGGIGTLRAITPKESSPAPELSDSNNSTGSDNGLFMQGPKKAVRDDKTMVGGGKKADPDMKWSSSPENSEHDFGEKVGQYVMNDDSPQKVQAIDLPDPFSESQAGAVSLEDVEMGGVGDQDQEHIRVTLNHSEVEKFE